jgi:hypothetical protein
LIFDLLDKRGQYIETEANPSMVLCIVAPEQRTGPVFAETQKPMPAVQGGPILCHRGADATIPEIECHKLERIVRFRDSGHFEALVPDATKGMLSFCQAIETNEWLGRR